MFFFLFFSPWRLAADTARSIDVGEHRRLARESGHNPHKVHLEGPARAFRGTTGSRVYPGQHRSRWTESGGLHVSGGGRSLHILCYLCLLLQNYPHDIPGFFFFDARQRRWPPDGRQPQRVLRIMSDEDDEQWDAGTCACRAQKRTRCNGGAWVVVVMVVCGAGV